MTAPALSPSAREARLLLRPGLVWLALFSFLPIAIVIAMSLAAQGNPVRWTLDGSAWVRLLDARSLSVLGRSAAFAALTTFLCLVLGTPLAWFVATRTERVRRWLSFLVLLPLWANTLALLCAWRTILIRDGVADRVAISLGLLKEGDTLGLLFTDFAVLLGLVYAYLPYLTQSALQSMERFDPRLIEAAMDLGATKTRALRTVLLPAIRPGLVSGCVLVFVPALATFVVPQILGGGRSASAGSLVRDSFFLEPQDWPLGAALATGLLAITGGASWAWFRWGDANG